MMPLLFFGPLGARVQSQSVAHSLSETLNFLGMGCMAWSDDCGILCVDPTAAAMLGLSQNSGTRGFETVLEKVHNDDLDKFRQAFTAPADGINLQFRVNGGKDNSWTLVHAVADNGATGIVVLKDVTAQLLSEQERARMIELFTETSQMESLGTLAGGIAHEINNPTQFIGDNLKFIQDAIGGLIAVAMEADKAAKSGNGWDKVAALTRKIPVALLAEEIPAAARQAIDGIERIGNIVQAIREFCYPGVKTPTPLSLNHLIEIAVTVTRNKWKNVAKMRLDLAEDIPMIVAVEGEIYQILVNLIVNAVHAIAEKKESVEGLITVATQKSDNMVLLSVSDTGIGIPPENLKRIFDMFFTTKQSGQGTGQGLAITQAIVYRHGGKLSVQSRAGEGSTFHVYLPALEKM